MVFAESAFVEACAGFQSESRTLCGTESLLDRLDVVGVLKICDGEIEIFDDFLHDDLAAVAGGKELFVGRTERAVKPGHIAVAHEFFEVEVCAEEACHAAVESHGILVGAAVAALQKVVAAAEVAP